MSTIRRSSASADVVRPAVPGADRRWSVQDACRSSCGSREGAGGGAAGGRGCGRGRRWSGAVDRDRGFCVVGHASRGVAWCRAGFASSSCYSW